MCFYCFILTLFKITWNKIIILTTNFYRNITYVYQIIKQFPHFPIEFQFNIFSVLYCSSFFSTWFWVFKSLSFILSIFYLLCYYSCPFFFSSLSPSTLCPRPSHMPYPLCSCPWVLHRSSLASLFPILFLTSPCLFYTYQLCFLFPVPFPWFSPFPLPTGNPPCDLHFCDFVPVLVVCLVFVFVF